MSEFPCFKCGTEVPPKNAVHTKDGKIVCQSCSKKLGIKAVARIGYEEVVRMIDRKTVEVERAKLKELMGEEGEEKNDCLATAHDALDWVLGELNTKPSVGLTE